MTNLQDYASSITFRFIQPQTTLRGAGEVAKLFKALGMPIDVLNTKLPDGDEGAGRQLRELCRIPRMSTIAIGAIIQQAVFQMPPKQAYVNVGVWNGFTFLAGLVNNAGKTCIGIDNFSLFGGPREAFLERFGRLRSPQHHFHDMDYLEYFAKVHRDPIGVYLYDGDHSYDNQLRGLEVAEPFFAERCIILVDDTNKAAPQQATNDFVSRRAGRYEVLFNQKTSRNCHPTFWDGLMIVQKVG